MTRRFAAALLAALLGCACDDSPTAPSDVTGATWRLASWMRPDAQPITVDDPGRYTIRFDDDGRLSIKSDCNSCGSSYTLNGSDLSVGAVACTLVLCPAPSLDPVFAEAVRRARTVTVRDGMLVLQGQHGTLQFRP